MYGKKKFQDIIVVEMYKITRFKYSFNEII
jgi:hypothetical protein